MVIFVIPAYNEADNIPGLLEGTSRKMQALGLDYRIIIVNDGSTDKTLQVIDSFKDRVPLEVHSYYPNKGVGQAFRTGFNKAMQICQEGDIVVTKEADNTSDMGVLDRLILRVKQGDDLVRCIPSMVGSTLFVSSGDIDPRI